MYLLVHDDGVFGENSAAISPRNMLVVMSQRSRNLPRRSCLSTPGSSDRFLAKAPTALADFSFLDLEDSVAPKEKEAARAKVVNAIRTLEWDERVLCVRVNAWDTRWTYGDVIEVVGNAGERLDEVMLPKVRRASDVVALDLLLSQVEANAGLPPGHIGIEAQIETAEGLINVEEICAASSRLESIVFGPADFAASIGMPVTTIDETDPSRPSNPFSYVFAKILMAGRANGLHVIDGPFLKVRDSTALRFAASISASYGFDGKWALTPDQATVLNEVYSPSQELFDKSYDILDAYKVATEEKLTGAVMFGDEMIDEASAKIANSFVARGERAGMKRTPQ
jgi:citrate lyase subunit beta/citryl-CoA lyase